jgi:integrase
MTRVWYSTLTTADLGRRTMYQTRHTLVSNALVAGEAPSWVAAMLGHASSEMLLSVYAPYIPKRTRRDGSALMQRKEGSETVTKLAAEAPAGLPKYSR